MPGEALLRELFVFRSGTAVIGVRIDRDTAARGEEARDFDIFGIHQGDQVLHDRVDAVFVEIAVAAEAEEIELQALALHHPPVGDVADADLREIRLPGDRAERREFGAVEAYPVVVPGMLVLESLEHAGIVVLAVGGLPAESLELFAFSCHILNIFDSERIIIDALVEGIDSLGALEAAHRPGRERQGHDFVEDLRADLRHCQLEHGRRRHDAPEHDREEDERVGEFTGERRGDGTHAEKASAGRDLHPAHHPGIDRRAHEESDQRSGRGFGHEAEQAVETFGHRLAAVLQRRGQPAHQLGHDGHESAEQECQPDHEAGLSVAVHLGQAVIQDIGYREQQHGAGELQVQPGHLPEARYKKVGGDQADDQRCRHHQEPGAEFSRHFLLVFYVVSRKHRVRRLPKRRRIPKI